MHSASKGRGQPKSCGSLWGRVLIVLCGVSQSDNVLKGHVPRILMILNDLPSRAESLVSRTPKAMQVRRLLNELPVPFTGQSFYLVVTNCLHLASNPGHRRRLCQSSNSFAQVGTARTRDYRLHLR